jgi:DNA adenine methylase
MATKVKKKKLMHLAAFSWYGGKLRHLNWLLPFINGTPHVTYAESFGGSGAVLLNTVPSPVEVFNDVHLDLMNFFWQLRDHKQRFMEFVSLTPYHHAEYVRACRLTKAKFPEDTDREALFLRGCYWFIKARQCRTGLGTTATPGRWAWIRDLFRRGMSLVVSRWLSSIDQLPDISDRLRGVQFEKMDGLAFIEQYDRPSTLHYIDPPYMRSTRTGGVGYAHEFPEARHRQLLDLILQVQGQVIISGYASDLYDEALKGWERHEAKFKTAAATHTSDGRSGMRQEVIWIKRHGLAGPKAATKNGIAETNGDLKAAARLAGNGNNHVQ